MRCEYFARQEPVLDAETFAAMVALRRKAEAQLLCVLRQHPAWEETEMETAVSGSKVGQTVKADVFAVDAMQVDGDAMQAEQPCADAAESARTTGGTVELTKEEIRAARLATLQARKDTLTLRRSDVEKDLSEHSRRLTEAEARLEKLNKEKHELVIKLKQVRTVCVVVR